MSCCDLGLLFDARKRVSFATTLKRSGVGSLIALLRRADPSFRVTRGQLLTAVNDDDFEIDIICRAAVGRAPHSMRMSDDEGDFWAVQIPDGDKLAAGRKFEQLVVAPNGEAALMRTLHPLDFIRLKTQLAELHNRDPQKAPKDRLQAQVVQALWDG